MTLARCALLVALVLSLGFVGCASSESSTAPDDDTVHTGFDERDGNLVTGSVDSIDASDHNDRNVNRLSDLLRGNTAGVTVTESPGGGIVVRIRGTNSIYGSNDPLYVVDGMPVQADPGGGLFAINPFDVESITVLKDAAATSMYGMDGANGVIVIETKNQ